MSKDESKKPMSKSARKRLIIKLTAGDVKNIQARVCDNPAWIVKSVIESYKKNERLVSTLHTLNQ